LDRLGGLLDENLVMHLETNDSSDLLAKLKPYEIKVWEALVLGNKQADVTLLDQSFLGVYPTGFAGKAEHMQQLDNGPTIESYELSAFKVLHLSSDCGLLSYRADFIKKHQTLYEAMYVSSIWQRRGEGWINLFSQDPCAIA
jgi:hypothetical protein